jgi:FlaA1/EpsC-like NDP-sugar epimerase
MYDGNRNRAADVRLSKHVEIIGGRVGALWERLHGHRRVLALLVYAGITAVGYAAAYLLRFDFAVPPEYAALFAWTLLPLLVIRTAAFRVFRLTRERWRYASTRDIVRLVASCVLGSMVFWVLFGVVLPLGMTLPISIIGMEAVLTCGITAGAWLSYRLTFEHFRRNGSAANARRALVIGAGDAGNLLAREMLRGATGYIPVGFVDDDAMMWGASVQGLEVIGATSDLVQIAAAFRAEELIIAVPSTAPPELRRIVACCEATGLPFKVLPGIAAVIAGEVSVRQLRDVRIEDLLGREPVELELPELAVDLEGQTVLITGAAGSIGSELSRQVALHRPGRLLLLDQAESELFYLELELRALHPDIDVVPLVADIADSAGVERVFRAHQPKRVFHAAAYKHVPLMESNAREAIRNNVIGTWRVAEAAGRHGADRFVLVSTDKAVRPSNVMGATKRLAELIVLDLQTRFPGTAYGAVRFGNVLGSNGSVIPIFERQIREGRPLTVTHPEATRYFMTISEAVQLILQASLLDEFRGHIAMLEMGEPVRIADLAINLLRLSGVQDVPDRIVYTGLRPGEKLHEELVASDEEARVTQLTKVRVLRSPPQPMLAVASQVESWDAALRDDKEETLLAGFFKLFPDVTARWAPDQETGPDVLWEVSPLYLTGGHAQPISPRAAGPSSATREPLSMHPQAGTG